VTTIIGIVTDDHHVILASDQAKTQERWEVKGDTMYRHRNSSPAKKIHVGLDGRFAVGMTGVSDLLYTAFLTRLLAGSITVAERTKSGYCPELLEIQLIRWNRRVPTTDTNTLFLATRYGPPALYQCWPLGLIELSDSDAIGSGAEYAKQVIAERKQIPERITLSDGLDLALYALERASQDPYTKGLDLVVVSPGGIREYGHSLREATEQAKRDQLQRIKAELAKPSGSTGE
jgi:hypothetical protein